MRSWGGHHHEERLTVRLVFQEVDGNISLGHSRSKSDVFSYIRYCVILYTVEIGSYQNIGKVILAVVLSVSLRPAIHRQCVVVIL